jgi:putative endopeptidase
LRILSIPLVVSIALSPATGLAAGPGSPAKATPAFDRANLDTSIKPCEDFYKFANGGWKARNPIPADKAQWGSFVMLAERNNEAVHGILEAAAAAKAAKGTAEQKLGDFYAAAMDVDAIEKAGYTPLRAELDRIAAIKSRTDVQDAMARLKTYGFDVAIDAGSVPDFKNSTQVIAAVGQGGLGLPDRDYYLNEDERSKAIRDAYVKYLTKLFELAGDSPEKAAAAASTALKIETRFAGASLTNVEQRNPNNSYHMMTAAERKAMVTNFDFERYLAGLGLEDVPAMNVAHPKFVAEVDKMLAEVPVDDWKTYFRVRVLDEMASTLSTPFVTAAFEFKGRTLSGVQAQSDRWKRIVNATNLHLGQLLGQAYVKQYFPPSSKERMSKLVDNLKVALREDLDTLPWMSDATRKQALAKLDTFEVRIGYPDKWIDYSALEIDRASYANNVLRTRQFAFRRDVAKIGKPVDRTEWSMVPQIVNASYNPLLNVLTFPAGILQFPFFNPDADDAINYGAIGMVIGHEITHGFDDQGSQFDAQGNLRNWWTEADLTNFKGRAQCIIDQYGSYAAEDGTKMNGKLVTGEAIADLGGIKLAWKAFKKSLEGKPRPADIDGFTAEQRFFLGFAQVWAENTRPEAERLQVTTDPHPLPRYRVNGTVTNLPEFYEVFGCADGAAMVRKDRCEIW